MNAISVSVKTNTVLVCKDLAEAQFRCLECCKAFISERHLVKHNHKRHEFAPYFITGFEQTDVANGNERKLSEVTGRLEKALSLLEAKTSSLDSTTSRNGREDTVREKPQAVNAQLSDKVIPVSPQQFLGVRRTVSLFTLPNDRACEPIVDGWMTQSASGGRPKIDVAPIGDIQNESGLDGEGLAKKLTSIEDTHQIISMPDDPSVEQEFIIPDEKPDDINHGSKISPQETPVGLSQEVDGALRSDQQTVSIEPLLINLMKKLDTVFTGNRLVTNSGCQTSETEESEVELSQKHIKNPEQSQLANILTAPGRKSVRFSDSPMYYGSSERHFNQSESECSSQSSGSKFEDEGAGFVENEEFQTYTNYSAQSHMTRPVYHATESAGETHIVYDPERTRVLESCPGQNDMDAPSDSCHSPDGYEMSDVKQDVRRPQKEVEMPQETEQSCTDKDESEDDCSRSRETAIAAAPAASAEEEPPRNPQPLITMVSNSKVRQSADYVATKKQILDIVEKCVKDLKAKRKQSNLAPRGNNPGANQNLEYKNSGDRGNSGSRDVEGIANQELSDVRKNFACKTTSNVICVGSGNVTADSQGILPPCAVICKDEELDIDELSGDSYERFMKRFYSRASEPERGDDRSAANYQRPNANQPCAGDQRPARHPNRANHPGASSHPNQIQSASVPQNEMCGGRLNVNIPSKESDLKKTDYAVLLHHETSQVQSLIDTLVSDLQRWRNVRRDHLSHAIRLQLEERLSSNLNLLGIQTNAKLLSDSAAATAHFLLKNRRSKSAKVSPSSYFDVLKYAFVNEVDRIAKSRVNNDHNPAME